MSEQCALSALVCSSERVFQVHPAVNVTKMMINRQNPFQLGIVQEADGHCCTWLDRGTYSLTVEASKDEALICLVQMCHIQCKSAYLKQ